MDISDRNISAGDRDTLQNAYKKLLDARESLMSGLSRAEQSAYRRGVIIDAVIGGVMTHLHEIASNQTRHRDEMKTWGEGTFAGYAESFVSNAVTVLTQTRG